VNEQQKEILTGYHLGMFRTLFWLIVVGAGIAGPLAGAFMSASLWLKMEYRCSLGLQSGSVPAHGWCARCGPSSLDLSPLMSGLRKATAFEHRQKPTQHRPLIGLLVVDVAMLLLAASVFITGPSGQYAIGWLGVLIFGCCTLYTTALFVTKCQKSAA